MRTLLLPSPALASKMHCDELLPPLLLLLLVPLLPLLLTVISGHQGILSMLIADWVMQR
jgi:hypothetical protein